MDRVTFITHGGKEILLLDFSGLKAAEAIGLVEPAKRVISSRPLNSILTLTDVTDIRFNEELSQKMKEFTSHNKPYVRAAAVVGITGLRQVIYNAVVAFSRRKIATFDTRDDAKKWLVEQC
jgi:Cu2+-containing amine oxidase